MKGPSASLGMTMGQLLPSLAVGYGAAALICAALSLDVAVVIELTGGVAGVLFGGLAGALMGRRMAMRLRWLATIQHIPGFVPPRGWWLVSRLIR